MVLAVPVLASDVTGNDLHRLCRGADGSVVLAQFYVAGFWDGAVQFGSPFLAERVCMPAGVTLEQTTDVVCEAVANLPGLRHENGGYLVGVALGSAFPCP